MDSKTQLNWTEQCSFCFKGNESNLQLFSLRYLCRHLKIEFKQLFFKCAKKAEHSDHDMLEVKTDLDKAEVNLCSECGKMIEKLTTLFQSLEKIQMEVDWWLQLIRKVITESDKNTKYFKADGKVNSIWDELIKLVRNSILTKSQKVAVLKPTLRLKRCNLKIECDFENQDISDFDNSIINACANYSGMELSRLNVKVEPTKELAETNDDVFSHEGEEAGDNYTCREDDGIEYSEEGSENDSDPSYDHSKDDKASSSSGEESESETIPSKVIDNGIRLSGSKRVKCKKCSHTFADSSTFRKHFKTIHLCLGKKLHKCHLCKMEYPSRDYLNKHLMELHGTKLEPYRPQVKSNFKCTIGDCDYMTKVKINFERHQLICKGRQIKVKVEMQKCQFCEEKFRSKSLQKRHERQLHSDELQKSVNPQGNMSNGIIIESNGKKRIQCKICQAILIDSSSFGRHFRAVHLADVNQCHLCPQKFTRRDHLYRHLRNLHNIEPIKTTHIPEQFKCDKGECNYVTKDKQKYHHHQKTCKGITKVINFTCDICGNGFEHEINLKQHKRTTHSGKVYKCDVCGKELRRSTSLKRHIENVHLKIRHECDHIGCKKSFGDKRLLSLHRKSCEKPRPPPPNPSVEEPFNEEIHEELQLPQYTMDQAMENCIELARKKYQCKVCNKIFKEKFIFRGHFKLRHVREKVFECDICSKKFILRHKLQRHKDSAHVDGGQLYRCDKGECQYTSRVELYFRKHQKQCRGGCEDYLPFKYWRPHVQHLWKAI